jgi:hypothetical protein
MKKNIMSILGVARQALKKCNKLNVAQILMQKLHMLARMLDEELINFYFFPCPSIVMTISPMVKILYL